MRRSVGGGPLRRQNLARAEPLTTLPRSARSRVSWSPNRCLLRGPPPTPRPCITTMRSSARSSRRAVSGCSLRTRTRARVNARLDLQFGPRTPPRLGGRCGCPRRRRSASDQETRDRAERGSVVGGSARASVVADEDTRADRPRDNLESGRTDDYCVAPTVAVRGSVSRTPPALPPARRFALSNCPKLDTMPCSSHACSPRSTSIATLYKAGSFAPKR